jgi:hypothetical protein
MGSGAVAETVSADESTSAISNLAAKTARQEISDLDSISFGLWPGTDDKFEERVAKDYGGLDDNILRTIPMAEVASMLLATPNMQPPREEAITEGGSSAVDAHFGAAWDGFTRGGAENTSGQAHLLPAFEEEGWRHNSVASVDAADAAAAPEADGQSFP